MDFMYQPLICKFVHDIHTKFIACQQQILWCRIVGTPDSIKPASFKIRILRSSASRKEHPPRIPLSWWIHAPKKRCTSSRLPENLCIPQCPDLETFYTNHRFSSLIILTDIHISKDSPRPKASLSVCPVTTLPMIPWFLPDLQQFSALTNINAQLFSPNVSLNLYLSISGVRFYSFRMNITFLPHKGSLCDRFHCRNTIYVCILNYQPL